MTENNSTVTVKKRGRPRIHPISEPYKKVGRGVPLRSQARVFVSRVREYFTQEKDNNGPLLPVKQVIERTSAALKIDKGTVVKIGKEKKQCEENGGKLKTPNKKIPLTKRVTGLDAFQKDAIRRHVYSYFTRKEYPTLTKLHVSLDVADLFHGSKSSLALVLKRMGFGYKKFGNRKCIMERADIVAWRCRFLREIRNENFDEIIWIDETWANTNHSLKKGWTDDTSSSTMVAPLGKGGRVIVLHAGSTSGFVPNCSLVFSSKKTNDYHEEMNHQTFQKWFSESLMPNLTKPSIIIMDNAKYHSKILDRAPTTASRKEEISEWLRQHGIPFEVDMKKPELLELVSLNKPPFPTYDVDEMAKKEGHKIVRLPPYHCHFNSIELIWAQIKNYVATNNKLFNMTDLIRILKEAIDKVTPSDWKKVVDHTKKVILEAWEDEGLLEDAVEQMIINVNGSDSDDSSTEDEDWNSFCENDGERIGEDNDYDSDISGFSPLTPTNERVLDFSQF